mgnify:CR=1 FL=1
MNYKRVMLTMLLGGAILQLHAQEASKEPATSQGWYVGLRGGLSGGTSTFVSAAADKYRGGMQDFPEVTDLTPYFLSKVY